MRRIEKRKRVCYLSAMNEKFYDLSKEKQDRMLNGAMQVFALYGYRHASTDEMVKAVGVSKGLWFHYFDSKKGLYHSVCSYAIRYMLMEVSIQIGDGEKDYFALREKLESAKMSLVDKYPYLPLIIQSVLKETDEEAIEVAGDIRQQYIDKIQEIYEISDRSIFADSNEARYVTEMLDASFENKLWECYLAPVFSKQNYLDGIHNYIEIIKKVVQNH